MRWTRAQDYFNVSVACRLTSRHRLPGASPPKYVSSHHVRRVPKVDPRHERSRYSGGPSSIECYIPQLARRSSFTKYVSFFPCFFGTRRASSPPWPAAAFGLGRPFRRLRVSAGLGVPPRRHRGRACFAAPPPCCNRQLPAARHPSQAISTRLEVWNYSSTNVGLQFR